MFIVYSPVYSVLINSLVPPAAKEPISGGVIIGIWEEPDRSQSSPKGREETEKKKRIKKKK